MKKILAAVLTLAIALSMMVMPVSAEEAAYRTLYSGEITSLNYLTTSTTNEFALAANVIDTLVEYNKYGEVQPSLAESWEYDPENLTYTFKIREGAKWVRANGEVYADVTAHDFVTAAKYILDAKNASATANIFYSVIEGAEAYYLGTSVPEEGKEPYPVMDWETVGVKAIDDYTLQYTLAAPCPYFLSSVTYVCFMPVNEQFLAEKGEAFGLATDSDSILYNGAYVISEFAPQQKRVLTKNPLNWDAENVFITTIEQRYVKDTTNAPDLFRKGEVDDASISNEIAAEWLANEETADLIRPVRQSSFHSYWMLFNFDPQFDAEYEPENWKKVVNNVNFRKAIYHGLDRVKAKLVMEPDNPESILFNTVTPPQFVSIDGVDYTKMGDLAAITELGTDTFNEELAKQYMDTAVAELKAEGATFPVKMLMRYNASSSSWAEECVVMKQQLEGLFGSDILEIIIVSGPSSGFLNETRRSNNFAFMKSNWGPDYADPNTYTDPFYDDTYRYSDVQMATEYLDENGVSEYAKLVDAARAITDDMTARYEAYAKAEAFLIENALVIPYGYDNGGYTASRLNPFEGQFAPFGISNDRYKGQTLLDEPMSTDQYFDALDAWEEARAALAE